MWDTSLICTYFLGISRHVSGYLMETLYMYWEICVYSWYLRNCIFGRFLCVVIVLLEILLLITIYSSYWKVFSWIYTDNNPRSMKKCIFAEAAGRGKYTPFSCWEDYYHVYIQLKTFQLLVYYLLVIDKGPPADITVKKI